MIQNLPLAKICSLLALLDTALASADLSTSLLRRSWKPRPASALSQCISFTEKEPLSRAPQAANVGAMTKEGTTQDGMQDEQIPAFFPVVGRYGSGSVT